MHPEIISDKNQSVKGDMRIGLRLDYRCQSSRLSGGAIGGGARPMTDNSSSSSSSGSSNVVASGLQWRHKKLSNHHHHQRQRQQFVADLKRSKELHLLKLNCCTTAAAAAALVRQANTSKRMNTPIDSSELIDLELARLNNLKLSDDLKYDRNNSQQQPQQATSIRDQHTDYYQSATMIIPSSTNNNHQPQQQQPEQQQHKQSAAQQAEPMETTGAPAPAERPLVVTSAPRGAGAAGLDHHDHHDHRHVHLNRHRHHDHNIDHHVAHGQHEQYQHQAGAQHFALNTNYTYHHLSGASNQLSANNYYFNSQDHQQQQQQVQRNYHNAQDQDQDQYQQSEVRLSLNDNFDNTNDDHDGDDEEADANQMIRYERIDSFAVDHTYQQQQHVDYVDLDDIKVVNKHQHQHSNHSNDFHQVQLVDRNKTLSPAYLPESVIRFNSQVAAAAATAVAATQQPTIVTTNLDSSGQYSRGHFAHDNERSAAHGQQSQLQLQSQYYNSSGSSGGGVGGGGGSQNAVNRLVSPTAHRGQLADGERCRNHAPPANQLTALNSVVPSSSLSVSSSSSVRATIGLHNDKQQPLEAQHYHQFASSSINSTYSNNNNNTNNDDDLEISTIHHHQHQQQQQHHHHHHHRDRHRHHHHAQYNNTDDLNESYDKKSGHRSAAAAAGASSNHNGPRQQLVAFDESHEAVIGAHDDDDEEQLSIAGAAPEVSYARQQHHATRLDNVISGSRHDDHLHQQSEPMDEFKVCEWYDCGNTFLDMDEFVRHLEVCHVNQEAREKNRYFCLWSNCKRNNQEFNARYKLLIHMRVHSGEKPYSCESNNCKKSFSRLENLKIHVRSHTGEKPYKCNYDNCSKSFTNSSDRIKHHKTHKDPKPYNCTYDGCMKRYTDPSSLRKHLRAHKRYYDSSSTDMTTIITPGSSRFDYIANNSSQTADHHQHQQQHILNSSYTSMTSDLHQQPQQQQQYHDLNQPQVNDLLSLSSASVSYHNHTHHQVHDSHLTTDYDPTKEFESILGVASDNNNQYSQSSARYSNSMNLATYDDHYNRSSGETRQFLDLDQQQEQQQQQQQGDTSKTFSDTFAPGRVACQGRAFGQVSQRPATSNKINSLKMNAIRHEQLSRSWCAGGSPFLSASSSSSLLSPSSRFRPNVRSERQLAVSNAYSYQGGGGGGSNNPAAECKPFGADSGQQQHWTQVGNVSTGSSNQLSSSNLNNNNQLQQTSDSNWQQQQRPVRVQQQHEQLMRSMPAGPLNGRLTDRLHLSGDNLDYLRTTNSNAYADNRDYRQSNFWPAEANNSGNNNNNNNF